MKRLIPLFLILAFSAFSDPLTLTVVSGAEQASAYAGSGSTYAGPQCSKSGQTQASCTAFVTGPDGKQYGWGNGQATTSWTTVSANGGGAIVYVPGIIGQSLSQTVVTSGGGTSSVADTLVVTGGTGTGYLAMNFTVAEVGGPTPMAEVLVNGQCLVPDGGYGCALKNYYAQSENCF